jgi:hypothetical protein
LAPRSVSAGACYANGCPTTATRMSSFSAGSSSSPADSSPSLELISYTMKGENSGLEYIMYTVKKAMSNYKVDNVSPSKRREVGELRYTLRSFGYELAMSTSNLIWLFSSCVDYPECTKGSMYSLMYQHEFTE